MLPFKSYPRGSLPKLKSKLDVNEKWYNFQRVIERNLYCEFSDLLARALQLLEKSYLWCFSKKMANHAKNIGVSFLDGPPLGYYVKQRCANLALQTLHQLCSTAVLYHANLVLSQHYSACANQPFCHVHTWEHCPFVLVSIATHRS